MDKIIDKVRIPDREMPQSNEILFLRPVLKEVVWGGSGLCDKFGYQIPSEQTGEAWVISAHPSGDCIITGGVYDGRTLSSLFDTNRELFGGIEGDRFPLLIKIIDAKEDLSIQVHPDDNYAAEHENGALGKTECWYVLDCNENTTIIIGNRAKSKEDLRQMIEESRWSELVREIPVKKGDFFQIEPGCLHAIKGGTMLLETQQNSDITYRVYDYDRLSNGKMRDLHISQSIDVITTPYIPNEVVRRIEQGENYCKETLIECSYYKVFRLETDGEISLMQDDPFLNVSVIDGCGKINSTPIKKGDNFILPAGFGSYTLSGNLNLIMSSVR